MLLGMRPSTSSVLATALLWCVAGTAASTPTANTATAIWSNTQSVFHISKSENHNEVHYSVRVDPKCHPVGPQPIFGYWRDYEKGPRAVSPLLSHELPAYGLMPVRSIEPSDLGGKIRVSLRAFPERLLTVEIQRAGSGCAARAVTTLQKQSAVLNSIFVQIGFLFSVEYAIARGARLPDGAALQEKLHD